MDKSPDAFRTISEVADVLETPAHVLRFWESRFPQIKPVKRAGGRRYYRPSDVALLAGIKRLLHDEGLTIRGVQKILRDQGTRHVAGLSDDSSDPELSASDTPGIDEAALMAALDAEAKMETSTDQRQHPLTLTEAAHEAFDDPEEETMEDLLLGTQPDLPLFSGLTAAAPKAQPVDRPLRAPPRAPRDDVNLVALLRGAAFGSLAKAQPELSLLAQRLARHRALLGLRADGGES